ncbi:MAG: UDP-N-acetylmuramoyl-L-alanine--D-glutamate ligase [Bacteroidales bacterium]|nr:UDP-N-acetylmuramoyl-L-alanine--D-glutamate ligase [Bacteroidales bacterium]
MNKEFIQNSLSPLFENHRIVILGLGKEGRSSLAFFQTYFSELEIVVADRNVNAFTPNFESELVFYSGDSYLNCIRSGDFVIKSPGISLQNSSLPANIILSSQTDLFLRLFSKQVIGITGTKGKSTTSSLIFHILKSQLKSVFLVGNIGVPALDMVGEVQPESWIVFEMSSHQLQNVSIGPSRAVILNFHQEHLDHYADYFGYREAKWQISLTQTNNDFFAYNIDDETLTNDLQKIVVKSNCLSVSMKDCEAPFSCFKGNQLRVGKELLDFSRDKFLLRGDHNVFNLLISLTICQTIGLDLPLSLNSAYSFQGLEHRLEFVGIFNGIAFYNDSIATIPEATINALKAVDEVATVILGGFDRGIDYQPLVKFLTTYRPLNLLLIGKVGQRLQESLLNNYNGILIPVEHLQDAVNQAFKLTPKGKTCLLSPAAASYDSFKNFEDRGNQFKKMVREISSETH